MRGEFQSLRLQDVAFDQIGNLFGRVPGGSLPPVIVCAHLDTVFSPEEIVEARREGRRLIGPGVGDNAVALAALLELGEDLLASTPRGDVWLVANVGEEGLGNLRGMRNVVSRFEDRISAYLILEGMALGHIYNKALPVRRFRITALARGGHSWIHVNRPSAIHTLIKFGALLAQIPLSSSPRTTLNIGRIEGGTSINSIAREATLELDLRSESEEALERLVEQMEALVRKAKVRGVSLQIEPIGHRPGGALPEDHPLVRAARSAYKESGESRARLEAASSDASYPLSLGLPAVCVGLTYGGEAHSLKEFIEIPPLERGYRSVLNLIRNSFGLSEE